MTLHTQLSRRQMMAALAAGSAGLFTPALASVARLPTDRYAPAYLLKFWRANPPETTLGLSKGETLPGFIRAQPSYHLHQPNSGAPIPAAQADIMRRRLEVAHQALLSQPSLSNIHGASLDAAINISVEPTDSGVRLVTATLSYNVKSIIADNPKTHAINGRYRTPGGEGVVLRLVMNPYEFIARRNAYSEGISGRVMSLYAGTTRGLMISDTPPALEWNRHRLAEKLSVDRSWYENGASGEHPMLVTFSSYRQANLEMEAGKMPATAGLARLAAATYMTDWQALHSRMVATR